MHKTLSIFFTVMAIALYGCDRAIQISKDELIEKTHHWKEPKAAIWYYTGSEEGRDYFQYYDLGASGLYSVQSGQVSLPRTFPLTRDHRQWIVMKWGPAATSRPNEAL